MRPEVSQIRVGTQSLDKSATYGSIVAVTKDQRIIAAIHLVMEADDKLGSALRMLQGICPLAGEHIMDAQRHNLDAITHMQIRPMPWRYFGSSKKNLKRGLTTGKKAV